jgi:magnesium transporter
MSNKTKVNRYKIRYNEGKVGQKPGTFSIPETALPTQINAFIFSENYFREEKNPNLDALMMEAEHHPERTYWIDLQGFQDANALIKIASLTKLNPLELEDIISTYQRPKIEEHPNHLLIIGQQLYLNSQEEIETEQISFIVGSQMLFTLQENHYDKLEAVRNRLRQGKTKIRSKRPDYIAYALIDLITDHYFVVLNHIGERLEKLEEELLTAHHELNRNQILSVKKDLLLIKRTIWPTREKINTLVRGDFNCISEEIRIFWRDVYDHTVQIMELTETYREASTSLMDLYMSSVSNRMNEIMKVLTMVSTIFIPLSFIAGVYGMNFSRTDATGNALKWNMPELYHPWGYPAILLFMVIVSVFMLVYFHKKKWL